MKKNKERSILKAAFAPLVLLPLALVPGAALASRTNTSARNHDFTYRDRSPRIHDLDTAKPHHRKKH